MAWPWSSKGAIVDTVHGVPIYEGYPPAKYSVLGKLTIETRGRIGPSTREKAADECLRLGGHALIWISDRSTPVISGTGPNMTAANIRGAEAYVIQFQFGNIPSTLNEAPRK